MYQRASDGLWVGVVDLGWQGGRRVRRTVYAKTATAVRRRLAEAKRDASEGIITDASTVADWMSYWLDHVAADRVADSTIRTYRMYVSRWIAPQLGQIRLDRLTPAQIRAMHRAMEASGLSSTSRRQVHAILSRALKVAVQERRVRENPAALIDPPRASRRHHAELTTDESILVLSSCTTSREHARWRTALLGGLRQGEALGLDWADVHLYSDVSGQPGGHLHLRQVSQRVSGRGVVLIPRIKAGAGEERDVPLLPELAAALEAWRMESGGVGLVFGHGDVPVTPESDHRAWKRICARAGVPAVPLHGARATTGTRLLDLGVPVHAVAAILGHASFATTLRSYARSRLASQQQELSRLPSMLENSSTQT